MTAEKKLRLSVLDLSPIASGSTGAEALHNSLDLAKLVDGLGYTRYWLAEHHNTALIASSAPEIMIGHVAGVTSQIRVGSGGMMLPNHTPLKVAETFRMLEALHPGRIDLGIGRAPGTDQVTALALRRSSEALTVDDFPEQLDQLLSFFADNFPPDHPFRRVVAIPQGVKTPDIWLLGSSGYSAQVAADKGLSFAFAHHISPGPAVESLRQYREHFQPSPDLAQPKSLLGISVVCAETEEEADKLASSADLTLLRFHQGRQREPLPSVAEALAYEYTPFEREFVQANRNRLFVGSPTSLRDRLTRRAAEAGVDELMITTLIHDHAARRRSYSLLAEAFFGTSP
jgi:luciferase family oxidoreductase group 1